MQWVNRLVELGEDWYYIVQKQGWASALPVVGRELTYLPYRQLTFVVVARSLLEPMPDLKAKIDLQIREFRAADLELVKKIERPSQAYLAQERLKRGHKGLIAFHNDQPTGYAWGCDQIEPTLERVYLDLEPGDMVGAYFYTAPAFRSKGIQTALLLSLSRLYKDLGFRRGIAYIEVNNYPSLATFRKVQYEVIGHLNFKRIGSWRKTTYNPCNQRNGR